MLPQTQTEGETNYRLGADDDGSGGGDGAAGGGSSDCRQRKEDQQQVGDLCTETERVGGWREGRAVRMRVALSPCCVGASWRSS